MEFRQEPGAGKVSVPPIAMGRDGAIGSKTRAICALIDPSVAKGCAEVVARCPPQAAGRMERHRDRAAQHTSAPPFAAAPLLRMEPIDTVPAYQGLGLSGHRVRTLGQNDRHIVTAGRPGVPQVCNAAAGLACPSAKSLVIQR